MWNTGAILSNVTADTPVHPARHDDAESLSSLLTRAFNEYPDLTQKQVAEAAGIPLQTLNSWVLGTRGTGGRIKSETLRALAAALPREYTVARLHAASGRRIPGELNEEREGKLLTTFRELTEKQQRALVDIADVLRRAD
jgi:transcriptional regulator with XRE-family HTH domain